MVRFKKTRKFIKILLVILIIYYVVIIFTPLSRWLADSLIVPSIVSKADVIIVLSGGSIEHKHLHYHTLNRLLHGIILWRQDYAPNLIVSGGIPPAGGAPDAYIMADMARKLGVDNRKIYLEGRSLTTRDNIVNCAAIMKKHGWKRALLVTSAIHMKRALQIAKEEGLECLPAPAPYTERYLSHYQLFQLVKYEYLSSLAQSIFGEKNFKRLNRLNRWLGKWKSRILSY